MPSTKVKKTTSRKTSTVKKSMTKKRKTTPSRSAKKKITVTKNSTTTSPPKKRTVTKRKTRKRVSKVIPPYWTNIERDSLRNKSYRKVIATGKRMQVVLMSLLPGEEVEKEIHPETDQFIRVEKGMGLVSLGIHGQDKYTMDDGNAILVPAGTWHRVQNISDTQRLQLYTIYAPPEHPADTWEKTKPKWN